MKKQYNTIEELIKNELANNEEPESLDLIKKMSGVKERGYCTKDEFLEICMWKSARPKRHYLKNEEEKIIETTKKVFSTKLEKRKIELLTKLNGILIPTASAILAVTDPKNYGIIDIRVWQILYLYGLVKDNPQGKSFDFDNWYAYLMRLRYFAKKFNVNARDIERTIFYHHRKIQEGKLYKSNSVSNGFVM
jgi:thermostable 8-oxoguanine DNA glycosylase